MRVSNLCLGELVEDTSLATRVPAITWVRFIRICVGITHHDFTAFNVGEGHADVINFLVWDIRWLVVSSINGPVGVVPDDLLG